MPPCNKSSFPCEIHLNIKYHVTPNLLISNKVFRLSVPHFLSHVTIVYCPCDLNFRHFLIDNFPPKVSVSSSINLKIFLDRFRQSNPKFVSGFLIARLYLGNDLVPPLDYVRHPPLESRFFGQTICHCVFCHFHRIRSLQVCQPFPTG